VICTFGWGGERGKGASASPATGFVRGREFIGVRRNTADGAEVRYAEARD